MAPGRTPRCGRVPEADSLYLLKVNVGEEQPRQVVSSLVKHYKEEELKDRPVVVYCNIKPGKMRNFESQAMVLAATKDKGADDEKCELLAPPKGAGEGTRMMCGALEAGSQSATQSVKHISKVWNQVQPLLQTNGKCEAMFSGKVLTMKDSPVTVGSLTGVGIY
uniref:tRNA-binding domain-containing protein n=1 Tax=Alexandrium andersonii TaxID=327968 RepID=A0A7S2CBH4_9DINO